MLRQRETFHNDNKGQYSKKITEYYRHAMKRVTKRDLRGYINNIRKKQTCDNLLLGKEDFL